MEESIEILEYKRRLNINKDKFQNHLRYVCDLFSIDGHQYLKRYGYISEEMVKTFIEMEKLKHKLIDLDYKCEQLKTDIIVDNNIDFKERLEGLVNREKIIDELHISGFMSSDMWEVLKDFFWNSRNKSLRYDLPKWKQIIYKNRKTMRDKGILSDII